MTLQPIRKSCLVTPIKRTRPDNKNGTGTHTMPSRKRPKMMLAAKSVCREFQLGSYPQPKPRIGQSPPQFSNVFYNVFYVPQGIGNLTRPCHRDQPPLDQGGTATNGKVPPTPQPPTPGGQGFENMGPTEAFSIRIQALGHYVSSCFIPPYKVQKKVHKLHKALKLMRFKPRPTN